MAKVWFITGSSRGLGRSLTAVVLANGNLVAATARNLQQLADLAAKYPDQVYPIYTVTKWGTGSITSEGPEWLVKRAALSRYYLQ
ncbi:hypothetical protein [Chitinophaga agrisoli]|uniref:hypothetical protein n=1 Tax=Chitinophaga agrisoli TaxID=2607653 RepID=UPI001BCA50F9|nr:hypothetical protein [Chitinophaga agrisoli]